MNRRWHWWILLIALIVGLFIIFWPAPVTQERVAPAADESSAPRDDALSPAATVAAARTATSSNHSDASLLNAQAINAWYAGDISGAMTLFEQAIERHPDEPEPFTYYGRLLTLMVSYEKALPLLEQARELTPDDAQAWLDLATLYERAQAFDESWAAQAEAGKLVGREAIVRDEQGRFVVQGHSLW